nr:cytochrome c oxidase assembly factor Coa1 family protein [uncultured Flavobacterium sp.]
MDNELIVEKSWWNRNWKWSLPTFTLLILFALGILFTTTIDGNLTDIAQAYSEHSLYEKAIEKAQTNTRVLEVIGTIEPMDQLAVLEGNAIYSNHNKAVAVSVRIKGTKGKGKMDIAAVKNGKEWEYQKISIRIKDPKEEIQILKDTLTTRKN